MKMFICCLLLLYGAMRGAAQNSYKDSMTGYISDYVQNHEVVTGNDKQYFSFYAINEKFRVKAKLEKVSNGKWFSMETSGTMKQVFRVFGTLHFMINDTAVKLNMYQSQYLLGTEEHKNLLFLPFTDLTSGEETYANGRYIDLDIADIKNNEIVVDFNKAYNPYCTYVSDKYNCPIPPKENYLPVAILAGEKKFLKSH